MSDAPLLRPRPNTSRHGRATEEAAGAIIGFGEYVILAKMRWSTPPETVAAIAKRMGIDGFDLDACSEDHTAQAPRYYTVAEDALMQDWTAGGWRGRQDGQVRNVWLNPPWSGKGISDAVLEAAKALGRPMVRPFPGTEAFVTYAWEQSRLGLTVALLLPQALDTGWQKQAARVADEVWLGGRIRFYDTAGEQGESPPGGHLLLIYRAHVPALGWPGGPRVIWDPPF